MRIQSLAFKAWVYIYMYTIFVMFAMFKLLLVLQIRRIRGPIIVSLVGQLNNLP